MTATTPVIESGASLPNTPLLEVRDIKTHFRSPRGLVRAVDGVSFTLERGKTLGIVGESGSGKSVLSRSIMGLNPRKTSVRSGTIIFDGQDISDLTDSGYRELWGKQMAMVFQDPMTSLNPVMRVGNQIMESLRHHLDMDRDTAKKTAVQLLRAVRIPEPEKRLRSYPHEMSGGMRQRVVIAIALACGPKLLFADEPTTALDVTVQAQILDLLAEQQRERFMAMVLVTHDLGVVANRADEIAVMYAGRIVEKAPTATLFRDMKMPYTQALLKAIPKIEMPSHTRLDAIGGRPPDLVNPPPGCAFSPRCPYVQERCLVETPVLQESPTVIGHSFACHFPLTSPDQVPPERATPIVEAPAAIDGDRLMAGSGTAHLRPTDEVLLRVENLVVEFPVKGGKVHAVSNISFDVKPGETLGLVGESGCGKSTTGRAIMQLPRPTHGSVMLDGVEMTQLEGEELRRTRLQMQMIFQDPISSLNPRRKVGDIVAEPLRIWKIGTDAEQKAKVDELLLAVGVDPQAAAERKPHEFSGGQCQRISIARAVATEPRVIICDEPVSALDVSVQAQILNLLEDMKHRYGLTMIFIAHDLAVVKNISDRVAVMYLGRMCEVGNPDRLYASPAHPYTAALISSIPHPDPGTKHQPELLVGELPSPIDPPSGCRFRTRCPRADELCAQATPGLTEVGPDHFVACHHPLIEPVPVSLSV